MRPNNPNPQNEHIEGEPLDIDELTDFATIDATDVEHAAEWWDEHASPPWRGVLDQEPIDDGR